MGAIINGETKCYVCNQHIEYVGGLGTTNNIESPFVKAESVIATGTVQGTQGILAELEIIVTCPKCESKNKTTNSIVRM